ncbi:MAG: metal ABC transporter permease [Planctomycetota bacterium]|nr:metal ABC transporter permease [Planctomycetota bacterium]
MSAPLEGLLELDATLFTVAAGATIIGAVSGGLGCFAYLRRQALVGDVISHAALLGVVGAFVLSWLVTGEGSKSLLVLVPGAIVAGIAALLLARSIQDRTRIKEDASLGVMLAIFFGGGLMMLRWVQRGRPSISGRAGLEDYVFGMAAAMTRDDLAMIGGLGALGVLVLALCWKELKLYTFDPGFAASLGLRTQLVDTLLLALLVLGIVIGLQAVGVVLMIALLVTPASAARQWTSRLPVMVALAALFGAVSGLVGALISATELRVPTGPVVVLVSTLIFVVSILFAPSRGVIARARARGRTRRESLGGGAEGAAS